MLLSFCISYVKLHYHNFQRPLLKNFLKHVFYHWVIMIIYLVGKGSWQVLLLFQTWLTCICFVSQIQQISYYWRMDLFQGIHVRLAGFIWHWASFILFIGQSKVFCVLQLARYSETISNRSRSAIIVARNDYKMTCIIYMII